MSPLFRASATHAAANGVDCASAVTTSDLVVTPAAPGYAGAFELALETG